MLFFFPSSFRCVLPPSVHEHHPPTLRIMNTILPRSGMQTRRRQKQIAKTDDDTREESHSAVGMDDEVMGETITESTREDELMEAAVVSVPELPVTTVKARRRLSQPKPAAASPKRAKLKLTASSTSPMLQRYSRPMEIPHSDILTPVAWVFDDKYQWWPGKVKHVVFEGKDDLCVTFDVLFFSDRELTILF